MSNFSLKWFKTEKGKMMESLILEEQRLKNAILQRQLDKEEIQTPIVSTKPYRKVTLVNDVLTVVMNDGSIFHKPGSSAADFKSIRECVSEKQLLSCLVDSKIETEKAKSLIDIEANKRIIKGFDILKSADDFIVEDGTVYLKEVNRSLPPLLIEKFAEIVGMYANDDRDYKTDEEFLSLKRFFLWACLNPRAEVADKLYDFLTKNGFKITKQGFFIALRNVVNVAPEKSDVVDFISNAYNKVKAVWKKNPADFEVYKDTEYVFVHKDKKDHNYKTHVGNLKELYINLPDMRENRFTDNWTKTFDIRIGKVVKMDSADCKWSTQDCAAAGLHFAGYTAPYVLCGDTTVFTLINPMKVIGIGTEKGRCYEYLPFMTTSVEEADEIMNSKDFDFGELDESYAVHELESLEDKVKEGFAKEFVKYQFNLPSLSSSDVTHIITSLNDMKAEIKGRVVEIK